MVTLPLPPSVNQIYRRAKWGRMFITKDAKQWKENAAWLFKQAIPRSNSVSVSVNAFFPTLARRDLDNLCKLIADSIILAGVIKDDNWQILNEWHIKGHLDRNNPRIEVEICSLKNTSI